MQDIVCIMVGSKDMMLNANIWDRQTDELKDGVRQLRTELTDEGKPLQDSAISGVTGRSEAGVRLVVVHGGGHHLQNDLQRDFGAEALLRFAQQC